MYLWKYVFIITCLSIQTVIAQAAQQKCAQIKGNNRYWHEKTIQAIAVGACLSIVASVAYIAGRMTGPIKLDFLQSTKVDNNLITVTLSIEKKKDSPLMTLNPNQRLSAQAIQSMFSQAKYFQIKIGDQVVYRRDNEQDQKAILDAKLAKWKEV